jgi:acetyl-CoA acetyltransferase
VGSRRHRPDAQPLLVPLREPRHRGTAPLSTRHTRRVAIVGAALSDIGRLDHTSAYELHWQATSRALADAGLGKDDVDGLGSCGLGLLAPVEIAEYLGLRPTWADGTGVGGSTWEFMVGHATSAILTGQAEVVVLVYGSTTRADLKARRRTANLSFGARGPVQFEVPYGPTLISKYAMVARRHMHEFGTTIEQLAEIAVSTRYNASLNPDAYYRDPITIDDVNGSRMIADPLTKLHCCIRSDGGGAVVLTTEERARDCAKRPVWVLGQGEALSHTAMTEMVDLTESPAKRSGELAFRRAGVTPADIDICQFYDAFTPMVLLTFEALGFCGKGEGGPFVADGRMRVGGALPTNTDGGGLSHCHPGMRGMFLLVEAVRQLRGEAGARQVSGGPQLCCVNGTGGWFSSASTVILGID